MENRQKSQKWPRRGRRNRKLLAVSRSRRLGNTFNLQRSHEAWISVDGLPVLRETGIIGGNQFMDQHGCTAFRRAETMSRREVLRLGGACGLGLTLTELLRAQTQPRSVSSRTFGQAKSVIVLYLHGGHAQQETWDPKPDGPSPARGEFGAIATSVPGVRVGELLPHSARLMHKLAVIRSLSHGNANHVQASLSALTGHAHLPEAEQRGDFPPSPTDFPPYGAVLDRVRPARATPTWVQVGPLMRRANGTVLHGQTPRL